MILLVIFILCFALSLIMYILDKYYYPMPEPKTFWQKLENKLIYYADKFETFFFLTLLISVCALIISFIFLFVSHITSKATIATNKEIYNSITYQLESGMYTDNSFHDSYGQRELMKEIEDWNSDLAYYLAMEKNPWVGCFYYPKFEGVFDFIELETDSNFKSDSNSDFGSFSSIPSSSAVPVTSISPTS